MHSNPSNARNDPTPDTLRKLSRFYAGLECVVKDDPDVEASIHHLNGDNTYSEFPNLIPLTWDLHNGLKPKQVNPERMQRALHADCLREKAVDHSRAGRSTRAYGCLRLAHALSAHFFKEKSRDIVTEFELAADCLYCLRRTVGEPYLELIYANLLDFLDREMQRILDEKKIIPPYGEFYLLVELGSWLSELGRADVGLDILRKARGRFKLYSKHMPASAKSRFQRQLANCLNQSGHYGAEVERALGAAGDCGDPSRHNEFGIYNTDLNVVLGKNDYKGALDVLTKKFDCFEKQTGYFCGSLEAMGPSIQTSLGYIGLSIIAEAQKVRSRKHLERLRDRLVALKVQEGRYRRTTIFNRVPGFRSAARTAAQNLPELANFLDNRFFPELPQDLADSIKKIADQL